MTFPASRSATFTSKTCFAAQVSSRIFSRRSVDQTRESGRNQATSSSSSLSTSSSEHYLLYHTIESMLRPADWVTTWPVLFSSLASCYFSCISAAPACCILLTAYFCYCLITLCQVVYTHLIDWVYYSNCYCLITFCQALYIHILLTEFEVCTARYTQLSSC